jgi:8-oxo-dGTP pyrophosphatase MutT (NUDIX family)
MELQDARAGKDPTKTYRLRAKMRSDGDKRWQALARTVREALITHDLVGMRGVGRLAHADKAEGFALWLREELRHRIFGFDGRWLHQYVQAAAGIAQRRAEELAPYGQVDEGRVTSMENLAVSELRGIVAVAQQQLTRIMTHALMADVTTTRAANALAGVIERMRKRTQAMSEYVIAKTHATTTLSVFRSAGVQQVGIIPERRRKQLTRDAYQQYYYQQLGIDPQNPNPDGSDHHLMDAIDDAFDAHYSGPGSRVSRERTPSPSTIARIEAAQQKLEAAFPGEVDVLTAGDEFVCIICEEISENGPYTLNEAEDLIPAHGFCRCAFVPAGKYARDNVVLPYYYDYDPNVHDAATEAAGVLFYAKSSDPGEMGRMLLMKRVDTGEWSIPAGHLEENEEPLHGAQREAVEETGNPGNVRASKVDERTTKGVRFHTFMQPSEQFEPILNEEHTDYGWFSPSDLPEPLHPGLEKTLRSMKVIDFNPYHEPAGSPEGGRFTSGGAELTAYHGTTAPIERFAELGEPREEHQPDRMLGYQFAKDPAVSNAFAMERINEVDRTEGNPYHKGAGPGGGQFTSGPEGGVAGEKRAFTGKPVPTKKVKLTKGEQDKVGEKLVIDYMKTQGMEDARSLNIVGNNYPIDLAGDHALVEVKTGLASNGKSAQQWRITYSTSKAEREWLDKASPAKAAAWNAEKLQDAYDRKAKEHKQIEKETGIKLKAYTVGVILNQESRTADIHVIPGYHKRVGWNSDEAKAGYKRTVKWSGHAA